MRTSVSILSNLGQGGTHPDCAHTCTHFIVKSSVYIAAPTVLFEYTKLQLGYIDCYW